jgi:hypothetical protein
MRRNKTGRLVFAVLCALALATSAVAKEELPETTTDGLVLLKDTKMRAVYVKPGATLAGYTKIGLLDCYVAFRKNWQRDHNDDVIDLSSKVSTKDMEDIKTKLAKEFREVFTKELQEKGGYEMVDKGDEDVLILRPAIMNLDVTAPDINSPGITRQIVASAGQMTLYMELFDGATGDIIARVIDPEADGRGGFGMGTGQIANSVTNRAAADRIMRMWAETLRKALDEVKGQERPATATNTTPMPGAKPAADAAPATDDKPKN